MANETERPDPELIIKGYAIKHTLALALGVASAGVVAASIHTMSSPFHHRDQTPSYTIIQ